MMTPTPPYAAIKPSVSRFAVASRQRCAGVTTRLTSGHGLVVKHARWLSCGMLAFVLSLGVPALVFAQSDSSAAFARALAAASDAEGGGASGASIQIGEPRTGDDADRLTQDDAAADVDDGVIVEYGDTEVTVTRVASEPGARPASPDTQRGHESDDVTTRVAAARRRAQAERARAVRLAKRAAAVREVRIVAAYRAVDAVHDKDAPVAQSGLDLYLAASRHSGLRAGLRFEVYRRVPSPALPEMHMVVKVGALEVVSFQGNLAVARVLDGPDVRVQPYLVTPGVIVGDFIYPHKPQNKAEAPVAETPPARGKDRATRPTRRPRADRRGDKVREGADPAKEPERALDRDPDSFQSWDDEPIDF